MSRVREHTNDSPPRHCGPDRIHADRLFPTEYCSSHAGGANTGLEEGPSSAGSSSGEKTQRTSDRVGGAVGEVFQQQNVSTEGAGVGDEVDLHDGSSCLFSSEALACCSGGQRQDSLMTYAQPVDIWDKLR